MASCAPTFMRTVSGGRSWANVVAGHPPTVKRKRVGWEPEEGVETRVYVTDIGDGVEYVPRGSGGGWGACPHSYWNHVPWVVGEISEDSINIDGVPVAQRTSFSSISVKDGDECQFTVTPTSSVARTRGSMRHNLHATYAGAAVHVNQVDCCVAHSKEMRYSPRTLLDERLSDGRPDDNNKTSVLVAPLARCFTDQLARQPGASPAS